MRNVEFITNCTASDIDIKYLSTSLLVTVTGPPEYICWLNSGTTEPEELNTFPNLTMEKIGIEIFWEDKLFLYFDCINCQAFETTWKQLFLSLKRTS